MASPSSLIPAIGPDGLAMDPPVIAYTEKVLEEKELEIKKYIADNYSKIRNVERELASLTFEIKMTAGPKKAALEHLRKKIELCGEKIKIAKQKEEQAKKVWEAAAKALKEEEDKKQMLCDDLNRLVQETAALQYSRLEEIKQKLEAVTCSPVQSIVAAVAPPTGQLQQALPNEESKSNAVPTEKTSKGIDASRDKPVAEKEKPVTGAKYEEKPNNPSTVESRNRSNVNRTSNNSRGRGTILRGNSGGQKSKGNNWTGAGFEVDDNAIYN